MRMINKHTFQYFVYIILVFFLVTNFNVVFGAKKVCLSKKNIFLTKGEVREISLKNVKRKVKWSIKNKKIVSIKVKKNKYLNKIKVKGLKLGKTVIIAKYKNKRYRVSVIVSNNDNTNKTETSATIITTTDQITDVATTYAHTETSTVKEEVKLEMVELGYGYFKLIIINNTSEQLSYGYAIDFEKEVDGKWIDPFEGKFIDSYITEDNHFIKPYSTGSYTIGINKNGTNAYLKINDYIQPGRYRFKQLIYGQTWYKEYVEEFTVASVPDESVTLPETTVNKTQITSEQIDDNLFEVSVINNNRFELTSSGQIVVYKIEDYVWNYTGIVAEVPNNLVSIKPNSSLTFTIGLNNEKAGINIICGEELEPGDYVIQYHLNDKSAGVSHYLYFSV